MLSRITLALLCMNILSFSVHATASKPIKTPPISTVRVGVSPATSTSGIFFAQELGFFKAENLEVELQVFPSSTAPMIPLLVKGDLDVGGGIIAAGLFATSSREKNDGILLVADKGSVRRDFDYVKLMVRKDHIESKRYKEFKDLKGFTIGVTALGGTSQEATLARILENAGLTPADVTFVKAGYADANKAFANKSIDAYVQIEPYVSEAQKLDVAKAVAGVFDIHPNQQSAAIFYSPKFVKDRRDVAVRFMRAYIRGVRAYLNAFSPNRKKEDFEKGVDILVKWTSVKDRATYNTMIPAGLDFDGKLNVDSLKSDLAYYTKQGYLKKAPDLNNFIDVTLVEEALKGLKQ